MRVESKHETSLILRQPFEPFIERLFAEYFVALEKAKGRILAHFYFLATKVAQKLLPIDSLADVHKLLPAKLGESFALVFE